MIAACSYSAVHRLPLALLHSSAPADEEADPTEEEEEGRAPRGRRRGGGRLLILAVLAVLTFRGSRLKVLVRT